MNESLLSDLGKLLDQYPELKNTTVLFNDSDFSVRSKRNEPIEIMDDSLEGETQHCMANLPGPDVIKGHSVKVEVRKSSVHGYGVFAKELIEKDELIEEAGMLKLGWRRHYHNDPVLNNYVWGDRSCKCNECEAHGNLLYLALGLGSLYNHSDNPNTSMHIEYALRLQTIKAKRNIEKDEEIFITYGKKYFLIRDFLNTVKKNNLLTKFLAKNRQAH
jgi:hypothetical protein